MSLRALLICILTPAVFLPRTAAGTPQVWVELNDCHLAKSSYSDGDSFHVICEGKNHHFRLYFVDCPETDNRIPERLAEQARAFGIPSSEILTAGENAHAFTRDFLTGKFQVLTKWEDARGDSKQQRFYAIVLVKSKNLATELVRNGWARVYGKIADFPDRVKCWAFRNELKQLEKQARTQQLGTFFNSPQRNSANRNESSPDFDADLSRKILRD